MEQNEDSMLWTPSGVFREKDLDYSTRWTLHEDYIKFEEIYKTKDGETIRHSCHVRAMKPLPECQPIQGAING